MNNNSDPDLYVAKEIVTRRNYIWKSVGIGEVLVQIHPWDKNFALGMYYIGVYGSKGSINSFKLTLNVSDPCKLIYLMK